MASSNEAQDTPPPILSLPREIRDEIYACVFDLTITPPDSLDDYRQTREDVNFFNYKKRCFIDFAIAPPRPSWMLLASCNRQLRHEILTFVRKKTTMTSPVEVRDSLVYELDFHLVIGLRDSDLGSNNPRIFLNWTMISALPILYAKSIQINLTGEGYHDGDEPWGVGLPFRVLTSCLYKLFAHGASFTRQSATRLPIRVEELRIVLGDCCFGEEMDGPAVAICELRTALSTLVYGGSLCSRVGVVTLLHYGELRERWVLSDFKGSSKDPQRHFNIIGWTDDLPEIDTWEETITLDYVARLFGEE
ncbi:MAG: hypothetical protein Q9184_006583 [Pyrenodesmia sp. 2 TL-2023]